MYLWLVAAGLSLIFGVLRVLNFAHGSLYMLGAYFAWIAFRISGTFWVALLVGPLLVCAVGWAMEFGFLRRVYGAPEPFQLLLTFAFVLIFDDLVKMRDRKSTRLNSSHQITSYAAFSFKKTHSTTTP